MPNPAYLNRATNSVILRITSQFLSKYLKSSSQPRNGAFRPSFALIRPVTAAVNWSWVNSHSIIWVPCSCLFFHFATVEPSYLTAVQTEYASWYGENTLKLLHHLFTTYDHLSPQKWKAEAVQHFSSSWCNLQFGCWLARNFSIGLVLMKTPFWPKNLENTK